MPRDEIRIFRGNVEAHIQWLRAFPSSNSCGNEYHAPDEGSAPRVLEYNSEYLLRIERAAQRRRQAANLARGFVEVLPLIAIGFAVVLLLSPSERTFWLLVVWFALLLFSQGIGIMQNALNGRARRS